MPAKPISPRLIKTGNTLGIMLIIPSLNEPKTMIIMQVIARKARIKLLVWESIPLLQ